MALDGHVVGKNEAFKDEQIVRVVNGKWYRITEGSSSDGNLFV